MKSMKRYFSVFLLVVIMTLALAPTSTFAATGSTTSTGGVSVDKNVYTSGGNSDINNSVKQVIEVVAGVGGGLFTLAVMCIAIFIIFGSMSPQKSGLYWKALLLCAGGAFIFFGAYKFAGAIAGISQGSA